MIVMARTYSHSDSLIVYPMLYNCPEELSPRIKQLYFTSPN